MKVICLALAAFAMVLPHAVAADPSFEAGQAAWSAYRDAHCEYVGATFGGGTGIATRELPLLTRVGVITEMP